LDSRSCRGLVANSRTARRSALLSEQTARELARDAGDAKKRRLSEVHASSFTQLFPSQRCIMLSRRGDLKSSTSAALLLRATSSTRLVIQTRSRVVQRVPKIHREPPSDREREREREREIIVLTLIRPRALVLSLLLN